MRNFSSQYKLIENQISQTFYLEKSISQTFFPEKSIWEISLLKYFFLGNKFLKFYFSRVIYPGKVSRKKLLLHFMRMLSDSGGIITEDKWHLVNNMNFPWKSIKNHFPQISTRILSISLELRILQTFFKSLNVRIQEIDELSRGILWKMFFKRFSVNFNCFYQFSCGNWRKITRNILLTKVKKGNRVWKNITNDKNSQMVYGMN